jgi:Na+/melibiose symporter-like transporter
VVPDPPPTRQPGGGLDVPGAVLAAAGLGMLVVAVTRAEKTGVTAPGTLVALAGSAAILAAFAVHERRAPRPLLRTDLLRPRAVRANSVIVANAGSFGALLVLSTLWMQRELGFSALEAGLGFVPLAVSAGVGGPLVAPLVERFGVRAVVTVSLVVTALVALWLARAPADASYATTLLPAFAIAGLTFATAAVPLTAEAVAEAREADKGVASALFQTSTHVGGAVVLAVLVVSEAAGGRSLAFAEMVALLALGAAGAGLRRRSRTAAAAGTTKFRPPSRPP